MFGSRVAKARFRQNRFIRALLAAQATLSSTISPALRAMPRLKVAVTFGVILVFGGLWDEMQAYAPRCTRGQLSCLVEHSDKKHILITG